MADLGFEVGRAQVLVRGPVPPQTPYRYTLGFESWEGTSISWEGLCPPGPPVDTLLMVMEWL